MVKILRVIARLNIGGPALQAILLTKGMNDNLMQSVLITGHVSDGEADMLHFGREHGVTPVVLPQLSRRISWWQDLVVFWSLCRIMVRERPDIVHTHTAKAGALGRLAAVIARVPIRVHTFHGHVFKGYFNILISSLCVWVERFLGLFTTCIIAISKEQAHELSEGYHLAPRHKFVVIPLGLDLARFQNCNIHMSAREHVREEQSLTIGMVGRLVKIKNHEMAFQVCQRLLYTERVTFPLRMIIVGDGELRDHLERRVRDLGLHDRISFEGWRSDLPKLYEEVDLVLLTSLNEGTPVALIEAMAAGLPFIATRVGGIPDLMVGEGKRESFRVPTGSCGYWAYDNGILVEPGDIAGCAIAVRSLAAGREHRQKMGAAGRCFVLDRHGKDRLLGDMRALYENLLKARGHEN